jgi:hypothetical protein
MPDEDDIVAYERAVGLVGADAWRELSDDTRHKMLEEELARLAAEHFEFPRVILT